MDRCADVALKHQAAADVAKALSNPVRLRILAALCQREMHVDELAARVDQSRGNTSAQLRALAQAGLVRTHKEGRRAFYRLADPSVAGLVLALQETTLAVSPAFQRMVDQRFGQVVALSAERARAVLDRVRRGAARLLDVRSRADHEAAHLPGAVSLPLGELEAHGPEAMGIPRDLPLVVYCRGRFCIEAEEAARLLRSHGYEVSNLYTSVAEAESLGLPVARSVRAPVARVS
jgi:DNA-binding transcriptional ArsR family regulator